MVLALGLILLLYDDAYATPNQFSTELATDLHPHGLAINPSNNRLYVSNDMDGTSNGTVTVYDISTDNSIDTITIGTNPEGLAIDSSNNKIWVANSGGATFGTVSVIDANDTVTTLVAGHAPVDIAIDQTTHKAYVVNSAGNTVTVFNTQTLSTVGSPITVGTNPQGIVADQTTHKVYVANAGDLFHTSTISVIDTTNNNQVTSISSTGAGAGGIALDQTTHKLYVANIASNSLTIIDTTNPSNKQTISQNMANPISVDVNTNNRRIYVANSDFFGSGGTFANSVTVYDMDNLNLVATLQNDQFDFQEIFNPFSVRTISGSINNLFVTNHNGNTVPVYYIELAPCSPTSGDWIITSSCTMSSNATANGNVIVQNNAVLTIPSGVILTVSFGTNHLLVKSGSGVLIKAGGAIN